MIVQAQALREMLLDGGEIALLDVREEAEYGLNHILLAVNLPLSRLELELASLVPRYNTRIVICDGRGEAIAYRGAARLMNFGYSDVKVLTGGVAAWQAAGFEAFSGMNVPSKAFGEFIEHHYQTPSISAEDLQAKIDSGEDMVILDSRPKAEYQAMNIPGGTCIPGAELVYRMREMAPNPNTLVVVNCAGRTRSIIGAQSLINARFNNSIVALRNGTMGWHLAGLELDHGQERYLPEVSPANSEDAQMRAEQVAKRFGVETIDRKTLQDWQQAGDDFTIYLLDVRSPEEYCAGHVPGAHCAPGGQLVQATDRYVATLRSRLVLIDDNNVRANMTASWLKQLGLHQVYVLEKGLMDATLLPGPQQPNALGLESDDIGFITVGDLRVHQAEGDAQVLDVGRSVAFRQGHIEDALHGVRGHLEAVINAAPEHSLLVLTSEDGRLAQYAAAEACQMTSAPVLVLAGGNQAWQAAGFELVAGEEGLEDNPVDAFLRPYDREQSVEEAMHAYLDWEVELINQIDRDGSLKFHIA